MFKPKIFEFKDDHMRKTALLLLVVIIIVASLSFMFLGSYKPKEKNEYFTLQPKTWIQDEPYTDDNSDIKINIKKATRNKAVVDLSQEDYFIDGNIISFFYGGYYKGNGFDTAYVHPLFYNMSATKSSQEKSELAKQYVTMKISPEMDPDDGVIEGFVLGKMENSSFVFYVFVDEDWKNKLKYTNIIWGDSFKDKDSLHMQEFDFTKQEKGIYIAKISEDTGWFAQSPRKGGIMVGEITFDVLEKLVNYEDVDATLMMVR